MEIERGGILKDVLAEDFLDLGDGRIVRNLGDLIKILEEMSREDFSLHVYGEQNDFAEWVMEAYWNEDLAGKLLKTRDKDKMIRILKKVSKKADEENVKKIVSPKGKAVLKKIGEMHG